MLRPEPAGCPRLIQPDSGSFSRPVSAEVSSAPCDRPETIYQVICMGMGVVCTSPGSGGVDSGSRGSGGGTAGLVAMSIPSKYQRHAPAGNGRGGCRANQHDRKERQIRNARQMSLSPLSLSAARARGSPTGTGHSQFLSPLPAARRVYSPGCRRRLGD